jgi:hypothetical protein
MKALRDGEAILLPGIFASRLECLGGCVLLAKQCGAEVVP